MNRKGVTIDKLAEKIKQKLDSKKALVIDSNIIFVEDNNSQLKATEMGLKIHGALKDNDNSKTTINIQNNQNIIVSEIQEQLEKVVKMFNSRDKHIVEGKVENS